MASTTSSSRRHLRRFAWLAAFSLWALPASAQQPSAADLASARELFLQAKEMRAAGNVKGAIERYRAAWQTAPTPIIGVEMGHTHLQAGELVEAREAFIAVGRLKVEPDETQRSAAARAEAAELAEQLRPKIPTLVVKVAGPDAATAQVTVDGQNVSVVSATATRKVNPGAHEVVARTANAEKRESVSLAEGETKEVPVDLGAGAGPPQPPATTSPASGGGGLASARPALIYGGFGVGAAGLVVGGVTGALALGKASKVQDACTGKTCPESARADVDSGRTYATISTVGFVVAGVGAAVGLVGLFVIKPQSTSAPSSPLVTPTAAVLPGGGFLGAKGRF